MQDVRSYPANSGSRLRLFFAGHVVNCAETRHTIPDLGVGMNINELLNQSYMDCDVELDVVTWFHSRFTDLHRKHN